MASKLGGCARAAVISVAVHIGPYLAGFAAFRDILRLVVLWRNASVADGRDRHNFFLREDEHNVMPTRVIDNSFSYLSLLFP
ncbi:hypothetical protein [Paraburkholderia bannensis]|uniref:hypothetical protein n=1 Tax=Paraburkholderia bannensis TaxID=765414 RepID=UPI0012EB4B7C|nr:hypothetical protein [Paraburkholderia bannensis]